MEAVLARGDRLAQVKKQRQIDTEISSMEGGHPNRLKKLRVKLAPTNRVVGNPMDSLPQMKRIKTVLALKVYAVTRQAERSLDYALHDPDEHRTGLRKYYAGKRLNFLKAVIDDLSREGITSSSSEALFDWSRLGLFERVRICLFKLAARSYARFFHISLLREKDARCLGFALTYLCNLLEEDREIRVDELIEWRTIMMYCEGIIQRSYYPLEKLRYFSDIETYGHGPQFQFPTLEELASAS